MRTDDSFLIELAQKLVWSFLYLGLVGINTESPQNFSIRQDQHKISNKRFKAIWLENEKRLGISSLAKAERDRILGFFTESFMLLQFDQTMPREFLRAIEVYTFAEFVVHGTFFGLTPSQWFTLRGIEIPWSPDASILLNKQDIMTGLEPFTFELLNLCKVQNPEKKLIFEDCQAYHYGQIDLARHALTPFWTKSLRGPREPSLVGVENTVRRIDLRDLASPSQLLLPGTPGFEETIRNLTQP